MKLKIYDKDAIVSIVCMLLRHYIHRYKGVCMCVSLIIIAIKLVLNEINVESKNMLRSVLKRVWQYKCTREERSSKGTITRFDKHI